MCHHLGDFNYGVRVKVLVREVHLDLLQHRVRDVIFVVLLQVPDEVYIR